jgi:hypothetical protein
MLNSPPHIAGKLELGGPARSVYDQQHQPQ